MGDAREGRFEGSEIPPDLQCQWIQGTARPLVLGRPTEGLRNVAYALLSGADGWMFDGEDALGQVDSMSLDNQRNLKLPSLETRGSCPSPSRSRRDERMGGGVLRSPHRSRLAHAARDHDTDLPRAGLHLDDRHIRRPTAPVSASIVDVALYIANNWDVLLREGGVSFCTCRRSRWPKRPRLG